MKQKNTAWKYLVLTGTLPFIIPIFSGIFKVYYESWDMISWLVLYSYIFWPTYLIGIFLIIIGLRNKRK